MKPILVILLTICALSPLMEAKEPPPGVDEDLWATAQKRLPTERERNQFLGRMYYLGVNEGDLQVRKDYRMARAFFLKAAAMGDTKSQRHLGHIAMKGGNGIITDYTEAAKWYKRAAEGGDSQSQASIAILYFGGTGVPKNYKEGHKWARKAAFQGEAEAQRELGAAYVQGGGVLADSVIAYAWYNIAAANGNEKAGQMKNIMHKELTREQIAKGQDLAKEMVRENPRLLK